MEQHHDKVQFQPSFQHQFPPTEPEQTAGTNQVTAKNSKPKVKNLKKDVNASITSVVLRLTPNKKAQNVSPTVSYLITCTNRELPPGAEITFTGNMAIITGLNPGTKYRFSVVAVNENGEQSKAVRITVTTPKYTAVKSLKAPKATRTADSFTLTWKPSTARAATTGYVIEVWDSSGKNRLDDIVVPPITDASVTTTKIEGLTAGTRYTFVVKATDDVFESIARKIKVKVK